MEKICKRCGQKYSTEKRASKYCPRCVALGHDILKGKCFDYTKVQTCNYCGREFFRNRKTKYCSGDCSKKASLQMTADKRKTGEYKEARRTFEKTCPVCNRKFTTKTKNTRYCSAKCSAKNNPASQRRNFNICQDKERLRNWEYRNWRKLVFLKDKHTCQLCGYNKGKTIVAHHLEGWVNNIDFRYEVQNGVTLCKRCHIKFHNIYGYGNNTRSQYNEFKEGGDLIAYKT